MNRNCPSFIYVAGIKYPLQKATRVYFRSWFKGIKEAGISNTWSYHIHRQEQREINVHMFTCLITVHSLISLLFHSQDPFPKEWCHPPDNFPYTCAQADPIRQFFMETLFPGAGCVKLTKLTITEVESFFYVSEYRKSKILLLYS